MVTIVTSDSLGSGFAYGRDATYTYVVTAYHVLYGHVQAPWTVTIKHEGQTWSGEWYGLDAANDLALVRFTQVIALLPRRTHPTLVGDPVLVVGSPFGLENSVSQGIVSALDVNVVGYPPNLIQTDAAINSGNSGGALLNRWSEPIGVVDASTRTGVGFAMRIEATCLRLLTCP